MSELIWLATVSSSKVEIDELENDPDLEFDEWLYGGGGEYCRCFKTKQLAREGVKVYLESEIVKIKKLITDL